MHQSKVFNTIAKYDNATISANGGQKSFATMRIPVGKFLLIAGYRTQQIGQIDLMGQITTVIEASYVGSLLPGFSYSGNKNINYMSSFGTAMVIGFNTPTDMCLSILNYSTNPLVTYSYSLTAIEV